MMKTRQGEFGADLALEFFAPQHLLSAANVVGLRNFFDSLLKIIDMQPLTETVVCQVAEGNPELDGVTLIKGIKTSCIDMHTWPGLGYGRLKISTCRPANLIPIIVSNLLKDYLGADVFYSEWSQWKGPYYRSGGKL